MHPMRGTFFFKVPIEYLLDVIKILLRIRVHEWKLYLKPKAWVQAVYSYYYHSTPFVTLLHVSLIASPPTYSSATPSISLLLTRTMNIFPRIKLLYLPATRCWQFSIIHSNICHQMANSVARLKCTLQISVNQHTCRREKKCASYSRNELTSFHACRLAYFIQLNNIGIPITCE